MEVLYDRVKAHHDRTVRCYLTLECTRRCPWCSAAIPSISRERRGVEIPADLWCEGINRRRREVILCGGEPLAYSQIRQLLQGIDPSIRVQIYSNLEVDIDPILKSGRRYSILASCHCDGDDERARWLANASQLVGAGQSVRVHIVKAGDWQRRRSIAETLGIRVTCCDDQRGYSKSTGNIRPLVRCDQYYYVYGPDGFRYPCVTLMGLGRSPREHISESDGPDGQSTRCELFGRCCGCDNLVEGQVIAL